MGSAAPGTGSSGDGTSHLLILQQLDVQISFSGTGCAGDVTEPCCSQVQRRFPVGKCSDDTCAPPDLAQDTLERIVGSSTAPVLFREDVIGERSSTDASTSSAAWVRRNPRKLSTTRTAFRVPPRCPRQRSRARCGAFGFLPFIHVFDGPEGYGASSFFETIPSINLGLLMFPLRF